MEVCIRVHITDAVRYGQMPLSLLPGRSFVLCMYNLYAHFKWTADLTWGERDCTLPPWAIWHGANGTFCMLPSWAIWHGENGTVRYHHGRFDMGRNGTVCYHHGRFAMGRNGTVCYHHRRFDMGRKGKGQKGTSPEEREFGTREPKKRVEHLHWSWQINALFSSF